MLEDFAINAKRFFAAAGICWQDSRVPFLAKLFVILAPLYWLHPADFIPDLQPGGQFDDIVIFSLLVVMALRLVPAAVFRDSSRAVSLSKKAAVVGLLYMTATTNMQCQAASASGAAYSAQQMTGINAATFANPSSASTITCTKATLIERQHPGLPKNASSASSASCAYLTTELVKQELISGRSGISCRIGRANLVTRHIYQATRSGQQLLYASADRLAYQVPQWAIYSFEMPPQSAGGFFVVPAPSVGRPWLLRS